MIKRKRSLTARGPRRVIDFGKEANADHQNRRTAAEETKITQKAPQATQAQSVKPDEQPEPHDKSSAVLYGTPPGGGLHPRL